MKFRARKRMGFGPYYRNYAMNGGMPRFTSHGIKLWRLNFNFTTRRWSFDTPGPGAVYGGGRR